MPRLLGSLQSELIFDIVIKEHCSQVMVLIHDMVVSPGNGDTGRLGLLDNLAQVFFKGQKDGVVHIAALVFFFQVPN